METRKVLNAAVWIVALSLVCGFAGSLAYYEGVYSDQPENYEDVESVIPIQTAYQSRTSVYYVDAEGRIKVMADLASHNPPWLRLKFDALPGDSHIESKVRVIQPWFAWGKVFGPDAKELLVTIHLPAGSSQQFAMAGGLR